MRACWGAPPWSAARNPARRRGGRFGRPDRHVSGRSGTGASNTNAAPHIIPNPFDNTLLVQSTPEEWEQISRLLLQLDVPPRQILVEAKILEVDLTGDLRTASKSYLQAKGTAVPSGFTAAGPGRRFSRQPGLSTGLNLDRRPAGRPQPGIAGGADGAGEPPARSKPSTSLR